MKRPQVPRKYIGMEIHIAAKLLFRNLQSEQKKAGLDDIDGIYGWILGYLYHNRNTAVYQKNIEAEFSIGRSTVTSIVKTLEESGYIRRVSVPEDARLKKLLLTEAGIQKHLDTISLFDKIEEASADGISKEDLETFFRVLDKIKNNTENMMGGSIC